MGTIQTVSNAISNFFRKIGRALKRFFTKLIELIAHIREYFRNLRLDPTEDSPFVVDAGKMHELFEGSPKVNLGIFEGVYNEETNSITHHRLIEAEKLDDKTQDLLSRTDNGLVVLS